MAAAIVMGVVALSQPRVPNGHRLPRAVQNVKNLTTLPIDTDIR